MKKQRENMKSKNGITLIALVVTIVVLLILAGITISTLFGENGIISAARKAEQYSANAENTTNQGIKNLEDQMAGKISDETETSNVIWKDNGNGTFTNRSKTVTIGDYVTYDPGSHTHTPDTNKGAGTSKTSGGGQDTPVVLATQELTTQTDFTSWRVLGVNEKGQLELISTNPTSQKLLLANDTGYLNAEDNLNKYCDELYGKGTNVSEARSLKAEDIEKLTKYDKTTFSYGGCKYGEKWQYQFPTDGTYMQSRKKGTTEGATYSDWSNITGDSYQKFRMPGSDTVINSANPGIGPELEYTFYSCPITSATKSAGIYSDELATIISNMILKGTGTSDVAQWLATRCISCDNGEALFRVHYIGVGNYHCGFIYYSRNYYSNYNFRVRPVVSLEYGVKLTGTGENLGTSGNPYTLAK